MLAIQQMLGQTNGPIEQIALYMQQWQDARLSMERMNDIHLLPDEEPDHANKAHHLPADRSIAVRNVSFQYPNTANTVLRDIQLQIPGGKITAIVGTSGSGKTTLLKLLLKYFKPSNGEVMVGNAALDSIANQTWRGHCGIVSQEGFVFADSILNNIAMGDEDVDMARVEKAAQTANIHAFVQTLPMGYHTPVGGENGALSQGQKQRILIARALYKNPEYLFFDEGTNALDTENQQIVMQNLIRRFKGKTMVIVAHRLSTILHADQIVVMEQGQIVEKGNHHELVARRGRYYELLTNQLEMAA
jgi:ATP-binding cassette, subfamily B, bacterial